MTSVQTGAGLVSYDFEHLTTAGFYKDLCRSAASNFPSECRKTQKHSYITAELVAKQSCAEVVDGVANKPRL